MIVPEREKGRRVDFKKMHGGLLENIAGRVEVDCGLVLAKSEVFFLKISLRETDGRRVLFRKKSRFFYKIGKESSI